MGEATLLLRLGGPIHAWDFGNRAGSYWSHAPSPSGVRGLLAAAQGRPRGGDFSGLDALSIGVRADQPGRAAQEWRTSRKRNSLREIIGHTQYGTLLFDARFLVGVHGDRGLLVELANAVDAPHWPLSLGRRECPPADPIDPEVVDGTLGEALRAAPWLASEHVRRGLPQRADVQIVRPPAEGETPDDWLGFLHDGPGPGGRFTPRTHYRHGTPQDLVMDVVTFDNPIGLRTPDWMAALAPARAVPGG